MSKMSKMSKMSEIEPEEPMLKEDSTRFTLFPIQHGEIWKCYKKAEAALWTAEELDFNADKDDWETLSKDEKYFIEHILAFFAGSDGIVLENLMSTFCKEVQWPEARAFYAVQNYIETVHSLTYSLLIDTYIKNPDRKLELFNAIETIPCVAKKATWSFKWMNPETKPFRERLLGFIIVEGVFFSGSFCAIFWLISKGKMTKALGKSNELIARDEGMHYDFGIMLYKELITKCTVKTVHEIFREAVEIEREFICDSLPCRLIGMNSDLMYQYIQFVADNLLCKLGYPTIYNVNNPFPFMDLNNMQGKSNFFEQRVSEYQRAYAVTKSGSRTFIIDDDF
jgi:ribonucleotide reductase beta subunit family protein with ferritin-like domain